MEDDKQVEQDRQRAEVFDALGHPTRILILKVLSEGSLGFADLKKKTGFESSGHLQHHLTKLNGLIKTDEYGKYCLSDEGKDALLTVQTVEKASLKNNAQEKVSGTRRKAFRKLGLKPVAILLVALLIVSSAIAVYEYNQAVGSNKESSFFKGLNPEASAYYNQFGAVVPSTDTNSSFAPPISMYQALLMGLQADDWNKTSLRGFTIYVGLSNYTSDNFHGFSLQPVTDPPANYSDVYSNGFIYRIVWQIDIQKSGGLSIPPWDVIFVDASTGQVVPTPPLA